MKDLKTCFACEEKLLEYATVDGAPWCRECFEAAVMLGDIDEHDPDAEDEDE